ncbi:MAG: hypothetical protein JWN56_1600 [Sphingobacteriales bacterium]|nr:hypothetical protein [Sphingobacteriales bacterium]
MIIKYSFLLIFLVIGFNLSNLFAAKKSKDIRYILASSGTSNLLDVYYPRNVSTQKSVLIFIHGGS